jgi:hypothetical protein
MNINFFVSSSIELITLVILNPIVSYNWVGDRLVSNSKVFKPCYLSNSKTYPIYPPHKRVALKVYDPEEGEYIHLSRRVEKDLGSQVLLAGEPLPVNKELIISWEAFQASREVNKPKPKPKPVLRVAALRR